MILKPLKKSCIFDDKQASKFYTLVNLSIMKSEKINSQTPK